MINFQLSDGESVELVEIEYLKAEIILELNTVHDWEHRGRGGATHRQHLRNYSDADADDNPDADADFDADESYHNGDENKH